MKIHPTAIIDPQAELDSTVSVGPYSLIGPRVKIGPDTEIMSQAVIYKDTEIGARCRIFPFASVGADPQDLKYQGERSTLLIGNGVTIREGATLHRGTKAGGGQTTIGDNSLIMATAHVAHDCRIGSRVIMANYAGLAGHIVVEDDASVGGLTAVHQFCRIGRHSFIGGFSRVSKDVPPFMLFAGVDNPIVSGPNILGLKRKNFSEETLEALKEAYRIIFRNHRPLAEVLAEAETAYPEDGNVAVLCRFFRESERGVYR